ncbi:MAG: transporter substrate-binding domain-containing protein, partial [Candidatus Riflebacteria bacterium]|nr:transporter substrate-binding domain-containing protein [Candidatus Riflebacteria bacterium]
MRTTYLQKQFKSIYILFFSFLLLSASILYADITNSNSGSKQELTTFEQLEKMRIGVLSSYANPEIVRKKAPNAKNFIYYNTNVDGVAAVRSNKIDCYIDDEPVLLMFANQTTG